MKIERSEIMLSTDMVASAITFLASLFLLIGFAMVLGID
jgi:hypothetical protein